MARFIRAREFLRETTPLARENMGGDDEVDLARLEKELTAKVYANKYLHRGNPVGTGPIYKAFKVHKFSNQDLDLVNSPSSSSATSASSSDITTFGHDNGSAQLSSPCMDTILSEGAMDEDNDDDSDQEVVYREVLPYQTNNDIEVRRSNVDEGRPRMVSGVLPRRRPVRMRYHLDYTSEEDDGNIVVDDSSLPEPIGGVLRQRLNFDSLVNAGDDDVADTSDSSSESLQEEEEQANDEAEADNLQAEV